MKTWISTLLVLGIVSVSVNGENQVWLTSPSDSDLKVGTESAPTLSSWSAVGGFQPWGVTFDSSSSNYFVSDANVGIVMFSTATGSVDPYVTDPGAVYHGIDAVGGKLYALRSGSDDLVVFDLSVAATPVVLASGFQRPNDVAVDLERGRIYVTDSGLDQVKSFNLLGNSIATWNLNGAWGVDIDERDGTVYVSSYDDGLLYRNLDGDGSFVSVVSGFDGPRGVEVDRRGAVFVMNSNTETVVQAIPALNMFFSTPYTGALDWELSFGSSLTILDRVTGVDVDGFSTFLEYAFSGDPTQNESSLFTEFIQNSGDGFSVSLTARDDADLLQNYFVSNNLTTWVEVIPSSTSVSATTGFNDLEFELTEADYFSDVKGRLFFRVSAEPNR